MTLYTLINLTTYIFLTYGSPTSIVFDSPIEFISMSNESDFAQYKSNDKKILTIKPYKNNFNSKIVVITKKGPYVFSVNTSSADAPSLYNIQEGSKGVSYFKKSSNEDYELLESEKIFLLRLKNNKYKMVNDVPARTQQYLPKNTQIKLDDSFITY